MSLAQLSQLLPLPEEELKQVLDHASTLSKPEAADHFSNFLGDSPLAIDFISSFNARRQAPSTKPAPATTSASSSSAARAAPTPASAPASASTDGVPKSKKGPKKKKAGIHTPEARKADDYAGPASKAYSKKEQTFEYIPQRGSTPSSSHALRHPSPPRAAGSVQFNVSAPRNASPAKQPPKLHASSAGHLISDVPSKSKSNSSSRSSTPKPGGNAMKVSIAGGTPMAGQSTALADLDAAIRALEITTNPGLDDRKSRKCNCVATRHPLQSAAPNCLSCGKVICMKEGLGPCTFCGTPLLNPDDVQVMVRELKEERGREKMAANASSNRRADVSKKAPAFSQPRGQSVATGEEGPSLAEAAVKAREHRDKLLNFQAQNAQRTTVRDEAADFDVGGAMAGTGSMWASPEERAKELKRQQKLMREMEWNAKPEYEKRQQVLSIDLVGNKVVRRMAAVERPKTPESEDDEPLPTQSQPQSKSGSLLASSHSNALHESNGNRTRGGGAFSGNPLLGAAMRPVFDAKGKGAEVQGRPERKKGWRRVQDDLDDNEGVILDGGVHGHGTSDEPER